MRDTIDGAVFKDMVINAALNIDRHKQAINELNVFPVPDGDTGTNMSLTMGAAMNELMKSCPIEIGQAAEMIAGALLRGARGNSGVILSLLFRGLARSLKGKKTANASEYAFAMSEGVNAAYKAVMNPSEGTILTVSRLAADAAASAAEMETDIEMVFNIAITEGHKALAETINQNPVLKKAGVIDAGGKGYMIILEAMLASMRGDTIVFTEDEAGSAAAKEKAIFSEFLTEDITFGYCTEFIVNRETEKNPSDLRNFLGNLGDSLVLVEDDHIIKVHVHTDRPGDVLTEALTYGSLLTIKIENMREQHTETIANQAAVNDEEAETEHVIAEPEKPIGVVAVCVGEGVEAVFMDLGADMLVSGGQTMNPSIEDILLAINKTPAETVFVLPNNRNVDMAARQCIHMTEKNVIVIPTETVPQGISAMLVLDPEGEAETNTTNMTAAISAVHTISLTYAARDSVVDNTEIREGDYLALLENKLLCTKNDFFNIRDVITETIKNFEPEFVTIFYGCDVSEEQAGDLSAHLASCLPQAEITTVNGGQPIYYYMISVE
ncbi:MAG: DAK2 domain-containing protein [Clostridiales bacterium]|nr:DAK2 domain-containing protein [Clostridiales bacterium]